MAAARVDVCLWLRKCTCRINTDPRCATRFRHVQADRPNLLVASNNVLRVYDVVDGKVCFRVHATAASWICPALKCLAEIYLVFEVLLEMYHHASCGARRTLKPERASPAAPVANVDVAPTTSSAATFTTTATLLSITFESRATKPQCRFLILLIIMISHLLLRISARSASNIRAVWQRAVDLRGATTKC